MRQEKTDLNLSKALLISLALITLAACTLTSKPDAEPLTLGYCPTWQELVKDIDANKILYGTTAEALRALNKGEVDAVIVGRPASSTELTSAIEHRLRDGWTIVSSKERTMLFGDITLNRVHTAATQQTAEQYLPPGTTIIYHDSVDASLTGLEELVMIPWSRYGDDTPLTIITNPAGNKMEHFRIPVIYTYNEETMNTLITASS